MKNLMEYKGYYGSVQYSDDDEVFYGQVCFLRDLVSYEGQSVKALKRSFKEAVDDYLELCEQEGRKPEQQLKGSFNVRTGPELHRKAWLYAERHGTNLNQIVKQALEKFFEAS